MTAAPPALGPETFAARRRRLLAALGPDSAALFLAAPAAVRSNDVEYPYRQDNDLLYLTGFPEPESAALLLPGSPEGEFHLFVRPRDPERETWTGRRAGVEGARERYRADVAHDIAELETTVAKLAADRDRFHVSLGRDAQADARALRWVQQWRQARPRGGKGAVSLCDPAAIVAEMRLIKEPAEIELLRASAAVARAAHGEALRQVRPGMREFEVEALIDFEFRRRGAAGPAYPSIVAAGANATILHYVENESLLDDGELLLIDAGAELAGYCSDVTRTFPVGARYSEPQRELYDIVLRAQKAAIDAVRPGATFDDPHRAALGILVAGLVELGLLQGSVDDAIEHAAYRPFYMHRTSHWLGLDVHDVGSYRSGDGPRVLEPGMVLTVEPGLYVASDNTDVDERFRGIGIRIEDDVLVTAAGNEVLTVGIAKEIAEVEALRAEALG
jgi:Xaa-Pro aminopeptidase